MGFIIGCNICNHPKEIGEIPTDDLNKIIKEQPFETLHKRQDSKMSSYEVNKINIVYLNIFLKYEDGMDIPNNITGYINIFYEDSLGNSEFQNAEIKCYIIFNRI